MASIFSAPELHKNKATHRYGFDVKGIDLSIVNAIRRTILTDIPSVGIVFEGEPSMSIEVNTGPLHNEILTHRMSMIPVHMDEEELEAYEDNTLSFELNKSNKSDVLLNITTHDMRILKNNQELTPDEIKKYFPLNNWSKSPILITRLRPKERIHMYGSFVKSTARENAGFSPVSLCSFYPYLNTDKIQSEQIQGVLQQERTFLQNDYGDPVSWRFEIEPETGLSVGYLVSKAFHILKEKLNKAMHVLSSDELEFEKHDIKNTFEYVFHNEDDTLGNMIQSFLHNKYYRTKALIENAYYLNYVGYYCPHPLDPKVNVRLTVVHADEDHKDTEIAEVIIRDILKMGIRELMDHMEELHTEWNKVTHRDESISSEKEDTEKSKPNPEPVPSPSEEKVLEPEPAPEPAVVPQPKTRKPRATKKVAVA